MTVNELVPGSVYNLDGDELIVFQHVGQTGMPIFQPLGEPDFQSCFGLTDLTKHTLEFVRKATDKDFGY